MTRNERNHKRMWSTIHTWMQETGHKINLVSFEIFKEGLFVGLGGKNIGYSNDCFACIESVKRARKDKADDELHCLYCPIANCIGECYLDESYYGQLCKKLKTGEADYSLLCIVEYIRDAKWQ